MRISARTFLPTFAENERERLGSQSPLEATFPDHSDGSPDRTQTVSCHFFLTGKTCLTPTKVGLISAVGDRPSSAVETAGPVACIPAGVFSGHQVMRACKMASVVDQTQSSSGIGAWLSQDVSERDPEMEDSLKARGKDVLQDIQKRPEKQRKRTVFSKAQLCDLERVFAFIP
ncbi:hypothetical protein GN956_G8508 [Arapaima gigas]